MKSWTLPILRILGATEAAGAQCCCSGKGPRPADGQAFTPHAARYSAETRQLDTVTGELGQLRQRYLCVNGAAEIVHRLDLFDPCFNPTGKGASCVAGSLDPVLPPVVTPEPTMPVDVKELGLADLE